MSDKNGAFGVSTDAAFQAVPCGIYFSLAVLGLCTPGVDSQTRSISMPVCLFKESVHGLVCCAASGINSTEIGAYFYYGLCAISLLLLRHVCSIPYSSII